MGPPSKVALASVLVLKKNESPTQRAEDPLRLVLCVGGGEDRAKRKGRIVRIP
jgi:hypothetical protein